MPDDDVQALLESIDTKLAALVALQTQRLLKEDPELAKPRPRSIDKLLYDVGLTQAQIAAVLGKTPQAVSQVLGKGKIARGSSKRTAPPEVTNAQ